eukprot:TRINITY_DN102695_c0_g1_i1.p1 TRINITY_DN102695_c0_g1~~TRINITY_DN102695_c0_g1_i1.p1  ORF type:complete len:864 (-),score=139.71 TRINITY_DN102695_c0_g1_i1:34-2625(-)
MKALQRCVVLGLAVAFCRGQGGSSGKSVAEVAVCITGNLRGVCSEEDVQPFYNLVASSFVSLDLFVVVPTGSDCSRASQLYPNATTLQCVPDEPLSPPEQNWLTSGPSFGSPRAAFLLQLRLVHKCGLLVQRHLQSTDSSAGYRWILRARADVQWVLFPTRWELLYWEGDFSTGEALLLPWTQGLQWQAFPDTFAIGQPRLMWTYLSTYSFVLNASNWASYDFPRGDCLGKRPFCHHGNYPELVLEQRLFLAQVPVRHSWRICFRRQRSCGAGFSSSTDRCHDQRHLPAEAYIHSHDDLRPFLGYLLSKDTLEAASYSILDTPLTFPAHYDHDAPLAAKLIEFLFREEDRIGRPLKIADVGCGRGTLVQQMRSWGLHAVGIDQNPLLSHVIPRLGLVAALAGEKALQVTFRSRTPRCNFVGVTGYWSADDEYIAAPSLDLAARICCLHLACQAFTTSGAIKHSLHTSSEETEQPTLVFVKVEPPPNASANVEIDLRGATEFAPGILAAQRNRGLDWIVSLDVGMLLPAKQFRPFVRNLAAAARHGVVLSWGRTGRKAAAVLTKAFAGHGFRRSPDVEAELRLFSGTLCCEHRRDSILVFRRKSSNVLQQATASPASCLLGQCRCGHRAGSELTDSVADLYDSIDPMVRPAGDSFWFAASCGTLVMILKLFRLLLADYLVFSREMARAAGVEWQYLLLTWKWWSMRTERLGGWIPSLLNHAARRAKATGHLFATQNCSSDGSDFLPNGSHAAFCALEAASRTLLAAAANEAVQGGTGAVPTAWQAHVRTLMATAWRSASAQRLAVGKLLGAGARLWESMDTWAAKFRPAPLPLAVLEGGKRFRAEAFEDDSVGRYLYRFAAAPD